jgi:hypothetical protein
MLDRGIQFARAQLRPPAPRPRWGQVFVEGERAIDQSRAIVKVSDCVAKGKSGVAERNRIIPSQLDRPLHESCGFGNFLLSVD